METVRVSYKTQIDWLLTGDSSIRYQTLRDLTSENTANILKEQLKILKTGWGQQIMALQDETGTWANCLYSPKWTSTFYTLLLLKRFGATSHPDIVKACMIILDKGFFTDGGINLWRSYKHSETCVTGMFLSILCHFKINDLRVNLLAKHLISQQMQDSGWNCNSYKGDTHSSFHTTLSVLEGLWSYQNWIGTEHKSSLIQKQNQGIEFLLQHKLFRSHRTGKIVSPKMTRLTFPPRWKYDIMKCLDYLQERKSPKDERMIDAIEIIQRKQLENGSWPAYTEHGGKVFFKLEQAGKPGRWNTLRALRILKWWNNDVL